MEDKGDVGVERRRNDQRADVDGAREDIQGRNWSSPIDETHRHHGAKLHRKRQLQLNKRIKCYDGSF